MNTVLWIAAGILAAGMLLGGLTKALKSKDQLRESGMGWVEPWPPAALRAIGCAEVLGAVGVILPGLLGIAPILVPIAAVCLAVTMVGAVIVHAARKEFAALGMPLVLLTLAVFVAVGRFSLLPF
ncbi:DoxX family protein [Tessaracoccus terricola]